MVGIFGFPISEGDFLLLVGFAVAWPIVGIILAVKSSYRAVKITLRS